MNLLLNAHVVQIVLLDIQLVELIAAFSLLFISRLQIALNVAVEALLPLIL